MDKTIKSSSRQTKKIVAFDLVTSSTFESKTQAAPHLEKCVANSGEIAGT